MSRNKRRAAKDILTDLILFVAFLVLYEEHATGGTVHEWLGITIATIMVIHIIFHWRWLTCLLKNFFGKLSALNRVKFVLNILIFFSFSSIIFSGIMMSRHVMPVFGIDAYGVSYWKWLHFSAVDITIWLTALHIALNWQRLLKMFRALSGKTIAISSRHEELSGIRHGSPPDVTHRPVFINYFLNIFIILLLSGTVAFLWYEFSFTPAAYSLRHSPRYEHFDGQRELHQGSGIHRNGPGHGYGRGQGRRDRDYEASLIGIWPGIAKNVMIISAITFGITLAGNGIRKSGSFHTGRLKKKLRA